MTWSLILYCLLNLKIWISSFPITLKHLCKVILYTRKLFFSRGKKKKNRCKWTPPKRPCIKNSGTIKCKISKFLFRHRLFLLWLWNQLPAPALKWDRTFCHLSFPVYTPDWWIPTDGFPLQAIPSPKGRIKFNICTSSGVTETYLPYHKTLNCLFLFRA